MILTSVGVSAQFRLGVKGGLNISELKMNSDLFKSDNRMGFFVGPTFRIIPFSFLSFDVSALYNEHNVKLGYTDNYYLESMTMTGLVNDISDNSLKQRTVDVPLNVRVNFGHIYVAAGPQLSFNIGDDIDPNH